MADALLCVQLVASEKGVRPGQGQGSSWTLRLLPALEKKLGGKQEKQEKQEKIKKCKGHSQKKQEKVKNTMAF